MKFSIRLHYAIMLGLKNNADAYLYVYVNILIIPDDIVLLLMLGNNICCHEHYLLNTATYHRNSANMISKDVALFFVHFSSFWKSDLVVALSNIEGYKTSLVKCIIGTSEAVTWRCL